MSERRFIISEVGDWGQPVGEVADCVVTESELKSRIVELREHNYGLNESIFVLVHGSKEQPKPDEWEEWASNLAEALKTGPEHARHLRKLFLSIPRNPRRKP